jgi:hypothetical protein
VCDGSAVAEGDLAALRRLLEAAKLPAVSPVT